MLDSSSHSSPGTARESLLTPESRVLVTGASGFLGSCLLEALLERPVGRIQLLVRDGEKLAAKLPALAKEGERIRILEGNLLSREDCAAAVEGVQVIYHLAAGTGTKSYPDAFLNSVVSTRNLIEAALATGELRRFVNTSSIAVYRNDRRSRILDETCEEEPTTVRGEAYAYAKIKQDELVRGYGESDGLPYVIVRPGVVYGPGKHGIFSSRVGIQAFGRVLHIGGGNRIPFTFRSNCAEAILLAGATPGIDGEVFNIIDDDLPTSRQFLRGYKRRVERVRSIYVPRAIVRFGCFCWEKFCGWSEDQLPPMYNRSYFNANWRRTRYSNEKLKRLTGWVPRVSTPQGMERFFESCVESRNHA